MPIFILLHDHFVGNGESYEVLMCQLFHVLKLYHLLFLTILHTYRLVIFFIVRFTIDSHHTLEISIVEAFLCLWWEIRIISN